MRGSVVAAALAVLVTQALADERGDCHNFNTPDFFVKSTSDEVLDCLDKGASLTQIDSLGRTPMFQAVQHTASLDVIDSLFLVASERDQLAEVIEHVDLRGRSIMHIAAAGSRDPAMITWLASRFASALTQFDCGDGWLAGCTSPLHLSAARVDGFIYVATLLAIGAIPYEIDRRDRTPGDLARHANLRNSLALLSEGDWGNFPESRVTFPSMSSVEPDCSRFLTAEFFKTSTLQDVAGCLAGGSYPTATDHEGNTALHLAAAHSADPRIIDLMMHRLRDDDPQLIPAVLERTNLSRRTALHHAAELSVVPEVVGRLLAWGANPNTLSEPIERSSFGADRGTTALHLAARRTDPAREAILTVLLASGASTLLQDHFPEDGGGRQALHYAARNPDVRVIELLQQAQFGQENIFSTARGSVVVDDRERTALHVAVQFHADVETISSMLFFRFSPDARDADGYTPLILSAATTTDPDVFLMLLESSEDPCQPTRDGATVESFLRENPALLSYDPTGADTSPLEAFKERCQ